MIKFVVILTFALRIVVGNPWHMPAHGYANNGVRSDLMIAGTANEGGVILTFALQIVVGNAWHMPAHGYANNGFLSDLMIACAANKGGVIDSKLSIRAPETPNQEQFISLSTFYGDAGWQNKATIRSVDQDALTATKGPSILNYNDEIEIKYILRIDGDSSPNGIPNVIRK